MMKVPAWNADWHETVISLCGDDLRYIFYNRIGYFIDLSAVMGLQYQRGEPFSLWLAGAALPTSCACSQLQQRAV